MATEVETTTIDTIWFSVRLEGIGTAQRTERLEEIVREFIGSWDPRTGHLPE